jgi:hypothetical protein
MSSGLPREEDEWTLPQVLMVGAGFFSLVGAVFFFMGLFNPAQDKEEDRNGFLGIGVVLFAVGPPVFVVAWQKQRKIDARWELKRRAATGAFRVLTKQTTRSMVDFTVGLARRYGIQARGEDPAADASELTLRGVWDWVCQTLEHDAGGPRAYAHPDGLGRVATALAQIGIDKYSVRLGAPLARLIPSKRRAKWKQLGEALGVRLPTLPPHNALMSLLRGFKDGFAEGVSPRAMLLLILLSPLLLVGMLAAQFLYAYFPEELSTAGQLAARVGGGQPSPAAPRWTPEQVWAEVCEAAAEAFGVEESSLTGETRLATLRSTAAAPAE